MCQIINSKTPKPDGIFFPLCVFLTLILLLLFAPSLVYSSELIYSGQQSKDNSVNGNSGPSAGGGTVSEYTGQHTEIFPLVSLPAGRLGNIDISMSYAGNVFQAVDDMNRRSPASWVGLGFNLGMEYIYCDHKGTVDYSDDAYFYKSSSGGLIRLLKKDGTANIFYPSNGALWRIERIVQNIKNYNYVVGWNIIRENGVKYIYGDNSTDFNDRNATWYILHWGNHTVTGATNGDLPFPIRWDIAGIEKNQNLYVQYTYDQVNNYLSVLSANGLTDNQYTQASYPKTVESSLGYSIEFVLANRDDYQDFLNATRYEYYRTKRLDKIISYHGDSPISHIRFGYNYLNSVKGSNWEKLILTSLQTYDSSDTQSLPPITFEYYNSPSSPYFGALKKVNYSKGGAKEICYGIVEPDSLLMTLNQGGRILFAERPYYAYSSSCMIRKYILEGQDEWHYDIGSFNGFWDMRTINDIEDISGDSSVTAGDGWVAFFNHKTNRFYINNWNSGEWERDTIMPIWNTNDFQDYLHATSRPGDPITVDSFVSPDAGYFEYNLEVAGESGRSAISYAEILVNNHRIVKIDGEDQSATGKYYFGINSTIKVKSYASSDASGRSMARATVYRNTHDVRLYAGNDFYIALDVEPAAPNEKVRAAYFYKKDGDGWNGQQIFNLANYNYELIGVSLGLDMYAISLGVVGNPDYRNLYYGKYNSTTKQLVKRSDVSECLNLIFTTGVDIVAWGSKRMSNTASGTDTLYLSSYNDDDWNTLKIVEHGLRNLVAIEDGIVFTEGHERIVVGNPPHLEESGQLSYYIRDSEDPNWISGSWLIGYNHNSYEYNMLSTSGSNSFILNRERVGSSESSCDVSIYEWNGTGWDSTMILENSVKDMSLMMTDEIAVIHRIPFPFIQIYGRVFAAKKSLSGEWSDIALLDDDIHNTYKLQSYDGSYYTDDPAMIQLGGDYIIACGYDSVVSIQKRYLYKWNYEDSRWDATDILAYSYSDPVDSTYYGVPLFFNGRFFLLNAGTHYDYIDRGFFSYQIYDDSFIGKPQIPVVKKIKLYPDGNYTNYPKVLDYSYSGGILDEAGNTPRFSRTSISTPYFENIDDGPIGYNIKYFYNDLDDDDFDDPYGDGSLLLPDLESSDSFGLVNGGYLLDGSVYYSYDSTVTEVTPSQPHDASRYFYKITEFSDNPYAGKRMLLDSVATIEDGVEYSVSYKYDSYGRKIEEITPLYDDIISHTYTEYQDFSTEYNIYDKVYETSAKRKSATQEEWVERNRTIWDYQNSEPQMVKQYTWPDASVDLLDGSEITRFSQCNEYSNDGRDQYGNLICWTNSRGAVNSVKYDSRGDEIVSSATNSTPNEYFFLDFEQPDGWDGWNYNTSPGTQKISDSNFTGGHSYVLWDQTGQGISGAFREITSDSLSYDKYIISAWVKTNSSAGIEISYYCNGLGDDFTEFISIMKDSCLDLGESRWRLIQKTIHLDTVISLDRIKLQLKLDGNGCGTYAMGDFAFFDDIRFHPLDAHVTTKVYDPVTYQVTSESGLNNIPTRYEYDDFGRVTESRNYRGDLISQKEYYYSLQDAVNYDTTNPNYVKTTKYFDEENSTVSVSYFDGLGRLLQTRSTNYEEGNEAALVTGVAEYDARGRVVKSYKPYYDLDDLGGVDDYSVWDSVVAEINEYYDGTPAANCNGKPYSENVYYDDYKGRLRYTYGPGDYSSHPIEYVVETNTDSNCVISTVYDQDDNKTVTRKGKWGRIIVDTAFYTNSGGNPDSMITLTYSDVRGMMDSVGIIQTSNNTRRILRRYWYDDLGREVKRWKIDYGYIRMIYDDYGNLRFMMNDKRKDQGNTVYYKYDTYGRKIEEGVIDTFIVSCQLPPFCDTINVMTQEYANMARFPDYQIPDSAITVKYRWYYDYILGSDIPINYGSVVRVENDTSGYYREYYNYPLEFKDSTCVKLEIDGGDIKSIVNKYNYGGQLIEKTAFRFEDSSDVRSFEYIYDKAGRLKRIRRNKPGVIERDELDYAIYDYLADGNIRQKTLGRYHGRYDDTAAVNSYTYDARGALTGINNLNTVQPLGSSPYINGTDSSHFAMAVEYNTNYHSGLISGIESTNSGSTGLISHPYEYEYNELGWLTEADHQADDTHDRAYEYNYLGNRSQITRDGTSIDYHYNTDSSQSSLLRNLGGWSASENRIYDELGNLYSDNHNGLNSAYYDYRNLMTWASVQPTDLLVDTSSIMCFDYDENGQRIKKYIYFWYFSESGGGGIVYPDPGDEPPGIIICGVTPDGQQLRGYSESHYLYDNDGSLLAIFNQDDSVKQVYVNGIGGQEAVYADNRDYDLYYFLKDHLGSTRVIIDDNGRCKQYINYYPFGENIEQWVSYYDPLTYTGKERDQHASFDYYYFGARYYDPELGMFSSIDKAGQTGGGFLYAGNNPISMNDPDGNWFGLDDLIAGAIGGTVNLTVNLIQGNVTNPLQALGYFGAGAAAGTLSLYGPAGWAAGGVILGASNTALQGGNIGEIAMGGVVGGIAGLAGGYAATAATPGAVSGIPIIDGVINGVVGGAAGGMAGGFVSGLAMGQSIGEALNTGILSAQQGMLVGGVVGGGAASINAYRGGVNPFTGKPLKQETPPIIQLQKNIAQGIEGEKVADQYLEENGFDILGERVSIRDGDIRAVADRFTHAPDGEYVFVEIKSGNASMTVNQGHNYELMSRGEYVTPVGNNAYRAGLPVGQPYQARVLVIRVNNGQVEAHYYGETKY